MFFGRAHSASLQVGLSAAHGAMLLSLTHITRKGSKLIGKYSLNLASCKRVGLNKKTALVGGHRALFFILKIAVIFFM